LIVISQFLTLIASSTTAIAHCRPRIIYSTVLHSILMYCTSTTVVLRSK